MSASYVLSRYFAFPSPGSSRYVEDRLPSFLTYPYPFELAAHAYAPTHRSIRSFPSYSRDIPCISVRKRVSLGLYFAVGSRFPTYGFPPTLVECSYPLPPWGHRHGGVGCNPGPLRRLSSLLPDPFEVGKGVKWGISHPTPTYQHMVKRFEVKTDSGRWRGILLTFQLLTTFVTKCCLLARVLLPNALVFQTRAEQGWVAVAVV